MTTQFVEMYHPLLPSTITKPARVAEQAVDERAAQGWLLVDPDGVLPEPVTPYYTKEALLSQIQGGASPIGTALEAAFGGPDKAHGGALGRISKSKTGVFRVLMTGTSIASFDRSPNQLLATHLKKVYGDCRETVYFGSVLGGSFVDPYNGWTKQPFGGIATGRAVGTSSSTPIVLSFYGDTAIVEYSKETDGGSWTVQIDGTTVGTINSNGAQAYGQKATFTTTLGSHTVTLNPPASGKSYLEILRVLDSTIFGVEVIDGTKGGSTLGNTQILSPASASGPTTGIPVVGWNGLDSIFGRTDVDLIICDHLVNDSSQPFADFKARVNRAVADTAATQTPLLWIIDPAGHFALPGDPGYAFYNQARDFLRGLAAANSHVYVLDWHALTIMDDLVTYAATYYAGVTGVNPTTGAFTGDFIHPNAASCQVGTSALCAMVGLDPPPYDTNGAYYAAIDTAPPAVLTPTRTNTLLPPSRAYQTPVGTALKLLPSSSTGRPVRSVPLYVDDAMVDYGTMQALIAASGTSDAYGKYLACNVTGASPVQGVDTTAERVTQTITAAGTLTLRTMSSTYRFYVDGVAIPQDTAGRSQFIYVGPSTPYTVVVEFGSDDANNLNTTMVVTGKVYEWRVTRQTGKAILARQPYQSLHQIGPETRIGADPVYDPSLLGQPFFEVLSDGTVVRKKLVSYAEKWNFATQTVAGRYGVYECLDRTAGSLRVARQLNGVLAATGSPLIGGGGESDSSNPGILSSTPGAGFPINLGGQATALVKPTLDSHQGVRIAFQNGGTLRYLKPDGTWQSSATNVRSGALGHAGENLSFTFSVPTGADLTALGNTPDFRVEWIAGLSSTVAFSSATIVRGQSACI